MVIKNKRRYIMFKFNQLFSKQKDDKIIIMGKSGSGKSFMAMQLAVNNKGTTILANGCEIAYKSYMESTYYPVLPKSPRPLYRKTDAGQISHQHLLRFPVK